MSWGNKKIVLVVLVTCWVAVMLAEKGVDSKVPHGNSNPVQPKKRSSASLRHQGDAICATCGETLPGYDGGLKEGESQVWPWSNAKYHKPNFSLIPRGQENAQSFRLYFQNDDGPISPFHDIPLFADREKQLYNMIVEIPRWTNAKLEISKDFKLNPIFHDVRDGNLRYIANIFPYHGYSWNYGSFPQTWEDPTSNDNITGLPGDNDPIDVCELSQLVRKPGDVYQVKVLGILGLIDQGETDWKVLAIDINDKMAPQLNDINDIKRLLPGFIEKTVEWFKVYKVPRGSEENTFAFNGEAQDKAFAHKVIMDTHHYWQKLVTGNTDMGPDFSIGAVTVPNAATVVTVEEANQEVQASAPLGPALPLSPDVDEMSYIVSSG